MCLLLPHRSSLLELQLHAAPAYLIHTRPFYVLPTFSWPCTAAPTISQPSITQHWHSSSPIACFHYPPQPGNNHHVRHHDECRLKCVAHVHHFNLTYILLTTNAPSSRSSDTKPHARRETYLQPVVCAS